MRNPLVSRDPKAVRVKLREQMEIYSYQFKTAITTFQKDAVAISGKVGGMKDDICICLQLACYFTQVWILSFCVLCGGACNLISSLYLQMEQQRNTRHTQPTLA